MSFTLGGREVDAVFVGGRPATAVYLGDEKVWPSAVVVPPVEPVEPEQITIDLGDLTVFGLAVNPAGTLLYACAVDINAGRCLVAVFDTDGLQPVGEIPLPDLAGNNFPLSIVVLPDGDKGYVATGTSGLFSLDLVNLTAEEIRPAPANGYFPSRLAVSADGDRVWLIVNPARVLVVDTEADYVDEVPLTGLVLDLMVRESEDETNLLVSQNAVVVLDEYGNQLYTINPGPTKSTCVVGEDIWSLTSAGNNLLSDRFNLRTWDIFGNILDDDIELPASSTNFGELGFVRELLFTSTSQLTVFVNRIGSDKVLTIDTESRTVTGEYDVLGPRWIAVHPAGTWVYASTGKTFDEAAQLTAIPIVEWVPPESEPEPEPGNPNPPPAISQTSLYTQPGTSTYTIPDWAVAIDVIAVGGGGGGGQGFTGGAWNRGGGAGQWATVRLNSGDFQPGDKLTVTVGSGGAGGNGATILNTPGPASPGKTSSVIGRRSITAAGGAAAGSPTQWGASPGTMVFYATYPGGVTAQNQAAPGGVPGAGGAASKGETFTIGRPGGAGGSGRVWIRAYANLAATKNVSRSRRFPQQGINPPFPAGWTPTENGYMTSTTGL